MASLKLFSLRLCVCLMIFCFACCVNPSLVSLRSRSLAQQISDSFCIIRLEYGNAQCGVFLLMGMPLCSPLVAASLGSSCDPVVLVVSPWCIVFMSSFPTLSAQESYAAHFDWYIRVHVAPSGLFDGLFFSGWSGLCNIVQYSLERFQFR